MYYRKLKTHKDETTQLLNKIVTVSKNNDFIQTKITIPPSYCYNITRTNYLLLKLERDSYRLGNEIPRKQPRRKIKALKIEKHKQKNRELYNWFSNYEEHQIDIETYIHTIINTQR